MKKILLILGLLFVSNIVLGSTYEVKQPICKERDDIYHFVECLVLIDVRDSHTRKTIRSRKEYWCQHEKTIMSGQECTDFINKHKGSYKKEQPKQSEPRKLKSVCELDPNRSASKSAREKLIREQREKCK